jgi:hypothetical protein
MTVIPGTDLPERRATPRHPVDEDASLLLVNNGSNVLCRISELSVGGCRVRTSDRFWAGPMVRVEASFKINNIAFRFLGVTQWTDDRNVVGVQFLSVTDRRKAELAEMLGEVETDNIAKAKKEAEKEQAEKEEMERQLLEPEAEPEAPEAPAASVAKPAAAVAPPQKPGQPVRMARHQIDGIAQIHFINLGSSVPGRIVDLHLEGCGIRTDEPFPVGIYTRVETGFTCAGLQFRLIGVVADIHSPCFVGIRFLDVSSRKKEQLEQLIEEVKEMRALEAMQKEEPGQEPARPSA